MAETSGPDDFAILRAIVTAAVREARSGTVKSDQHLRERLRGYERTAVAIGLEAQTIQVIRSGRRLLGDRKTLPDTA